MSYKPNNHKVERWFKGPQLKPCLYKRKMACSIWFICKETLMTFVKLSKMFVLYVIKIVASWGIIYFYFYIFKQSKGYFSLSQTLNRRNLIRKLRYIETLINPLFRSWKVGHCRSVITNKISIQPILTWFSIHRLLQHSGVRRWLALWMITAWCNQSITQSKE